MLLLIVIGVLAGVLVLVFLVARSWLRDSSTRVFSWAREVLPKVPRLLRKGLIKTFGLEVGGRRAYTEWLIPLLMVGAFSYLGLVQFSPKPVAAVVLELVIITLSFGLSLAAQAWLISPVRGEVLSVVSGLPEAEQEILLKLANKRLQELGSDLSGLVTTGVRAEEPQVFKKWFEDLFALEISTYIGVDSLPPGDFWRTYRWYLDLHEESIYRRKKAGIDVKDYRVLVTTAGELYDDYYFNDHDYDAFLRWHTSLGVRLMWIKESDAKTMQRDHELESVEVGLWHGAVGRFAVPFLPPAEANPEMHLRGFRLAARGNPEFDRLNTYVEDVTTSAEDLDGLPDLEIVEESVAAVWNRYLGIASLSDSRKIWEFLEQRLAKLGEPHNAVVLDAAAGTGWDALHLIKRGYRVWANEVDLRFARQLRKLFEENGVSEPFLTNYAWEDLGEKKDPGWRLDVILVLGNSLSLVRDTERRRRCLANLWSLLEPNGILIVDERNFQFMLNERDAIEEHPEDFPTVAAPDVMYAGTDVRGYPAHIDDSRIDWRLINVTRPRPRSKDELASRWIGERPFLLFPFEYGELFKALKAAHFSDTTIFADLTEIGTEMPRFEEVRNALFFTYVARRQP